MASETVLLLGTSGQLGHQLQTALRKLGDLHSCDRTNADLSHPHGLRTLVRRLKPTVIVNAAAYTAVDKAESDIETAQTVNAIAPGVLAEEASLLGACIVHYSTDYVFDGSKTGYYNESDVTGPLSVYGSSKLAGERAVAQACSRHLILRASWVVGAHGGNFLKTMLRLAKERDALRVVSDQVGTPTSVALIADITVLLLQGLLGHRPSSAQWGLYHVAAAGETSWHGYASHVVERALERGIALSATSASIAPITTAEYPLPARRPANSRLDTRKLCGALGIAMPDWRSGVDEILEELISRKIA